MYILRIQKNGVKLYICAHKRTHSFYLIFGQILLLFKGLKDQTNKG